MAVLTPKQEKFCQKYIELGNASEAYRQSYDCQNMSDETINVKASELLKNGKITVRLNELRQAHQDRHNINIDSLLNDLADAYKIAKQNENPTAMIGAVKAKAQILGLEKNTMMDMRLKELDVELKRLEIERTKSQMVEPDSNITINVVRVGK